MTGCFLRLVRIFSSACVLRIHWNESPTAEARCGGHFGALSWLPPTIVRLQIPQHIHVNQLTILTVLHSTCLFYQMVTLNVAVNSYSNALLTLLLSNQFIEIKSTVFKKFEKENVFQITCADIVERFQLWLMLSIIISRNLIELGVRSSSEIFLMVLGSETLVDWLKHAYITKFNQIRPKIYETFLDVLCRDYYSYVGTTQPHPLVHIYNTNR